MIPQFPKFKKLGLDDKTFIEEFTKKYPTYSDFTFTSMWSWNFLDDIELSLLNKNLVVKFNDYLTGQPFYSFIGDRMINETINTLLKEAEAKGLIQELRLIPDIVIKKTDTDYFSVKEDRDNFDYIVPVSRLKSHNGENRKLSSRRRLIKKFKENNEVIIKPINIHDTCCQDHIKEVFEQWEIEASETMDTEHLRKALHRLFNTHKETVMLSLGVYLNNELVGYSVNEILPNGFAVGHFQHGNKRIFNGIYALLMEEVANYLSYLGCEYINIEQDLGLPGLKNWKSSYKESFFHKKYVITHKNSL